MNEREKEIQGLYIKVYGRLFWDKKYSITLYHSYKCMLEYILDAAD